MTVPVWYNATHKTRHNLNLITSHFFSHQEKSLKCTVYRITGSIPASNYLQLPKTSTQSLGLTGRYLYILLKPIPGKYFVVHLDVATQDGLVVRISFSNLFREFKSTSTWLQFPFVCQAGKGSVEGPGTKSSRKGQFSVWKEWLPDQRVWSSHRVVGLIEPVSFMYGKKKL